MWQAKVRLCVHCGANVDRIRWNKGKHWCANCGTRIGLIEVYLQSTFAHLSLRQRVEILRPFLNANPLWTAILNENPVREE